MKKYTSEELCIEELQRIKKHIEEFEYARRASRMIVCMAIVGLILNYKRKKNDNKS